MNVRQRGSTSKSSEFGGSFVDKKNYADSPEIGCSFFINGYLYIIYARNTHASTKETNRENINRIYLAVAGQMRVFDSSIAFNRRQEN